MKAIGLFFIVVSVVISAAVVFGGIVPHAIVPSGMFALVGIMCIKWRTYDERE